MNYKLFLNGDGKRWPNITTCKIRFEYVVLE
jgi:hypothetical protein